METPKVEVSPEIAEAFKMHGLPGVTVKSQDAMERDRYARSYHYLAGAILVATAPDYPPCKEFIDGLRNALKTADLMLEMD